MFTILHLESGLTIQEWVRGHPTIPHTLGDYYSETNWFGFPGLIALVFETGRPAFAYLRESGGAYIIELDPIHWRVISKRQLERRRRESA